MPNVKNDTYNVHVDLGGEFSSIGIRDLTKQAARRIAREIIESWNDGTPGVRTVETPNGLLYAFRPTQVMSVIIVQDSEWFSEEELAALKTPVTAVD